MKQNDTTWVWHISGREFCFYLLELLNCFRSRNATFPRPWRVSHERIALFRLPESENRLSWESLRSSPFHKERKWNQPLQLNMKVCRVRRLRFQPRLHNKVVGHCIFSSSNSIDPIWSQSIASLLMWREQRGSADAVYRRLEILRAVNTPLPGKSAVFCLRWLQERTLLSPCGGDVSEERLCPMSVLNSHLECLSSRGSNYKYCQWQVSTSNLLVIIKLL